jgi:3-methyladenine DNA glycosylase Tag
MEPVGGPRKIKPKSLADYFEVMTKAVFQSGISWRVVEAKWDGFRKALKGFDPGKVANFTPRDVDRLAEDTGIIRNRRKIEATVENAETMVALDREHGGLRGTSGSTAGLRKPWLTFGSSSGFSGARDAITFCTWWERRYPATRSGRHPGTWIRARCGPSAR